MAIMSVDILHTLHSSSVTLHCPRIEMRYFMLSVVDRLFDDSANISLVRAKLTNVEALKKARVHPLKILTALRTYLRGKGERGKLVWEVSQERGKEHTSMFY